MKHKQFKTDIAIKLYRPLGDKYGPITRFLYNSMNVNFELDHLYSTIKVILINYDV